MSATLRQLMCRHPRRWFTVQRYEKKCICAKKVYFYCHRLHFFTVASRIKVPSKVVNYFELSKSFMRKLKVYS